jgi:NAD(P)-dependent dehydrogenase (short-subunit alcohol dehydrogenase family)
MWLYMVALLGLWMLLRFFRERQVVDHLQDKYVFITGCGSGFGNLLARQLDRRGMRVLAACRKEEGAEELRRKTSERLETVILDVTKTENIVAATQWVKERVGNRGTIENPVCVFGALYVCEEKACVVPKGFLVVVSVELESLQTLLLSSTSVYPLSSIPYSPR